MEAVMKVEDEKIKLLMEAGYIYLHMNETQKARGIFEAVALLAPKSDVPMVALGNTYFAEKRYDEALKQHEAALGLNPESALAKAHMGEVLYSMKKADAARKTLFEAIKMDPDGKSGAMAKAVLDMIDLDNN